MTDDQWDIISRYTRAEALADGTLVDPAEAVGEDLPGQAGMRVPVAFTRRLWAAYIEVPHGARWQDEKGRLWDVLSMARFAMLRRPADREIVYQLYVVCTQGADPIPRRRLVSVKVVCGPGDTADPTLTFMLPEED